MIVTNSRTFNMKPTETQINKLLKFVNALYQNKIIDQNARLTEKGSKLQYEFIDVIYHNLLVSSEVFKTYIDTGDDSDLKEELGDGYIWLLTSNRFQGGNWNWVSNMNQISVDLDKIIDLNYEMYKIPKYTELEKAADLLADNEFDDI